MLITESAFEHGHDQSFESFELAKQYCQLHAAMACILMWIHNRELAEMGDFFAKGEWLVVSLHRLLSHFRMTPLLSSGELPAAYHENVAQELLRLHKADKMFSIVPFQLAQSQLAPPPSTQSSSAQSHPNQPSTQEATSPATAPEPQLI